MAESLHELLDPQQTVSDGAALKYLAHLADLPARALAASESQQLTHASHSVLLQLQALSKRCRKPLVTSAASHSTIGQSIPAFAQSVTDLGQSVPRLDGQAESFAATFSKAAESDTLARRKRALRMLQNSERLVDAMELPPLLNSAIRTTPVNYSSSLELYTHIRRLASLYPGSPLVSSIMEEADVAIRQMAVDLISSLKAPTLKLAAALRTVGWLKRIVPDLTSNPSPQDALPALYLVCRVVTLLDQLDALGPLKELAREEQLRQAKSTQANFGGQQTEKFLKRYIEIFREHTFNIASVFKSVNANLDSPLDDAEDGSHMPLPSAIATLPLHLVEMLLETLREHLPTVKEQAARESILTQVLYCSGSFGRLGADFGVLLSTIGVSEWADLVKRHRLLAGRLESVIGEYSKGQGVVPV